MNEEFDVCVIGSGPAGAFVAHELAGSGLNVAVVEAGDEHLNSDAENLFDTEGSNIAESIDFGFSQQIGGASNLWAGGLAKMDDVDLCERPDFGFQGWPVTLDELNIFYKRVDKIIDIDGINHSVDNSFNQSIEKLTDNTGLHFRRMMVMGSPFCTSKLVKNTKNITLFKNHASLLQKWDQGTHDALLPWKNKCDTFIEPDCYRPKGHKWDYTLLLAIHKSIPSSNYCPKSITYMPH